MVGWLHDSVNMLKTTELHPLNGRIVWYVDYVSIKLLLFFFQKIYIYVYEKIGKTLWGLFPPPGAHLTPPGRVVRPRAYGEGPQEVPDPSALLLPLTHPEWSGQGPAELSRYRGSCRFAHSRNGSSGSCACDRQVTVDAGASG